MEDLSLELKELITTLAKPLVDDPDAVAVTSTVDDGRILIEIEVAPDDVGKIIGRQGRIIKSIRSIARAAGSRHGIDVDVELAD